MIPTLIVWLLVSGPHTAQRGVVKAATLSSSTVQVGAPVSIHVTGSNPCGAVHVGWGDGTAITYPIVELPWAQKHVYQKPGQYVIAARGMGNCDGETTVALRVEGKPAPPDAPQLTSVVISAPAPAGSPVGLTLHGSGDCRLRVEFGDGHREEILASLPHTIRHVYPDAGTYIVRATAEAPCEGGRHTIKMDVSRGEPAGARLLGVKVTPQAATVRDPVTFEIDGRGRCHVTIDFGDGSDQTIETSLPARITHVYRRPGAFEFFAWTGKPCGGEATGSVRVRSRRR